MNAILKKPMRWLWTRTAPIRRPFSRKLTAAIRGAVDSSTAELVHPPLADLLNGVSTARREVGIYRNETNRQLDALVYEMARLQDEVEGLRAELARLAVGGSSLVVVSRAESA